MGIQVENNVNYSNTWTHTAERGPRRRSWSSWALICLRSGSPRRAEPNAAARAPCIQFTAALLPDVYFGA
ncbi:unnamed protein product [Danaus chrysippus]|uniref:(African queen) hypothetical protein n=1 Tax=Danaus chrysippus TaxID=151541 RepID=A0A8J2QVF6_9NEOP|nr:unnamed protein product [Danaus chrysippus]